MLKKSEFYKAPEKLLAYRDQSMLDNPSQWWYHDAVFSNGYSMQIMPLIDNNRAAVWLTVCDSEGNVSQIMPTFDRKAVVASTEVVDVKFGEDMHMFGTFPKYEIHFHHDDMGVDLVYECQTQVMFEPPDGFYLGREQVPATPLNFAWVFRPNCKITGRMIIGGKEISIEGEGYADHQWKNVPAGKFQFHYWTWGKLILPKHTLCWWDAQLNENFGYQRAKWLWTAKGDKVMDYSASAALYVGMEDWETEPKTGARHPRTIRIIIDEPEVKGTAVYKMKHLLVKVPISHFGTTKKGPEDPGLTHYFRHYSDCHYDFVIEGEKYVGDIKEVHEMGV